MRPLRRRVGRPCVALRARLREHWPWPACAKPHGAQGGHAPTVELASPPGGLWEARTPPAALARDAPPLHDTFMAAARSPEFSSSVHAC